MARHRIAVKAAKRRKFTPEIWDYAILDEEMRRIDRMLNDRPLKCLNWRTPREAYTALLYRHLLAAA